jgi:hypothetical protein
MPVFKDLLRAVRRVFLQPPKIKGKPTMIIPSFADLRDGSQTEKVQAQCQQCAKQLASHLYRWERSFPQKSLIKIWEPGTLSFVTVDLDSFGCYLMQHYALYTDDGNRWLADRVVADRIMQVCVGPDSPLPLASWQLQTDRKREAVR